jgi:hypothetical protein
MANRFQIRSGSSTPSPLDLLDKELGYNVNDKKLYINNNGSIQEITTDIIDNLITNDSDKALSAKQGKLLNEVKLDSSAYTAADVLAKVRTVDGAGSGLDADTLDGKEGLDYVNAITYYGGAGNPIDPNTTAHPRILTNHSNIPPGSSNFAYIDTIFYSSKSDNRLQIAYGYSEDNVWFRRYYNGTWNPWRTLWHDGNRPPAGKLLWKGSGWNSGNITVTGSSAYTMFLIRMEGQGTVIPAFKYEPHIRGMGGYSSNTPTINSYQFAATVSGDTWTFVACNNFTHNPSGSHGTLNNRKVTSIIGVI